MATMGQPGKAGKTRRDAPSGPARGRVISTPLSFVSVPVRQAERIGTALMASLGLASGTSSPMANGNGGNVTLSTGAGIVGRDSRRTGPLQNWVGAGAPVARDRRRATVGAQGGPSSQPAFPSTGNTQTPSLVNVLSGLDTPYSVRNPSVGG